MQTEKFLTIQTCKASTEHQEENPVISEQALDSP